MLATDKLGVSFTPRLDLKVSVLLRLEDPRTY